MTVEEQQPTVEEVVEELAAVELKEPRDAPEAEPRPEDEEEKEEEEEDKAVAKSSFIKFFIADIGVASTEESVRAYFEQFGAVERVVVKHSLTPRQRSFAFVTIDGDPETIMTTRHVIDGQAVATPEFARSNSAAGAWNAGRFAGRSARDLRTSLRACRKIFVGGLSHQTHEDALRAHFEQFGKLTDVVVMHEAGGNRPRGFGFVTFAESTAAQKVLQTRFHPINGRGVEVKLAIPRELMLPEQQAAYGAGNAYAHVPYGEYVAEHADYPIAGYTPHPMPPPHHVPPTMSAHGGQPAMGIRVLYGTEAHGMAAKADAGMPSPDDIHAPAPAPYYAPASAGYPVMVPSPAGAPAAMAPAAMAPAAMVPVASPAMAPMPMPHPAPGFMAMAPAAMPPPMHPMPYQYAPVPIY